MNKGLTIRTAQHHGQRYLPRLLEHAAKGELDPSYLATRHFPLEDGLRAYEMVKSKGRRHPAGGLHALGPRG